MINEFIFFYTSIVGGEEIWTRNISVGNTKKCLPIKLQGTCYEFFSFMARIVHGFGVGVTKSDTTHESNTANLFNIHVMSWG